MIRYLGDKVKQGTAREGARHGAREGGEAPDSKKAPKSHNFLPIARYWAILNFLIISLGANALQAALQDTVLSFSRVSRVSSRERNVKTGTRENLCTKKRCAQTAFRIAPARTRT